MEDVWGESDRCMGLSPEKTSLELNFFIDLQLLLVCGIHNAPPLRFKLSPKSNVNMLSYMIQVLLLVYEKTSSFSVILLQNDLELQREAG